MRIVLFISAAFTMPVLCCLLDAWQTAGSPTIVWHEDYAKALSVSRQSSKPLFVVFCCLH